MPELPEVEITVRRLDAALREAGIESALAPGVVALKSVKPPLDALAGATITGIRRIGKMPVVGFDARGEELTLLVHMMSAGRLQLFDKRGSLRDRRSRILIRVDDGRELRLRELGTKQRAWVKLMPAAELEGDEMIATLGPEAWPAPSATELARILDQRRHLHPMLRDQRVIAGIGRSWVDEILWRAKLSPFKQGAELTPQEAEGLAEALGVLGEAIDHYERVIGDTVPDKLPMPLQVHRREGEPCPRCGDQIAAIHYSEHTTCYCPAEQSDGKRFADRRLSRLLK